MYGCVRRLILSVAVLALAVALAAFDPRALMAQGSSGGVIGKQGKSATGSEDTPTPAPSRPRPRRPQGDDSNVSTTQAGTRVFDNPKVNGLPLDGCMDPLVGCGLESASYWCRSKGFARASAAQKGASGPTRFPVSGGICNWFICEGFSQVTCEK